MDKLFELIKKHPDINITLKGVDLIETVDYW